jgi:hypothetical protein
MLRYGVICSYSLQAFGSSCYLRENQRIPFIIAKYQLSVIRRSGSDSRTIELDCIDLPESIINIDKERGIRG